MPLKFTPIVKNFGIVLLISVGWLLITDLNNEVFGRLAHSIRAHWIFLPAGFRPIIILLFDQIGALGLVLGGYLTVMGTTGGDESHAVTLSLILGITPWLAVRWGKRMMAIPNNLAGLKPRQIVSICTLCSAFNALTLNGYLWLAGKLSGGFVQIGTVFVGDLVGSAIVMFALSTLLVVVLPRRP